MSVMDLKFVQSLKKSPEQRNVQVCLSPPFSLSLSSYPFFWLFISFFLAINFSHVCFSISYFSVSFSILARLAASSLFLFVFLIFNIQHSYRLRVKSSQLFKTVSSQFGFIGRYSAYRFYITIRSIACVVDIINIRLCTRCSSDQEFD